MSSANHPFLSWIAPLKATRAVRADGKDVILEDRIGKEFAVGIHGQEPLLCYQPEHQIAMDPFAGTRRRFSSTRTARTGLSCRAATSSPSPRLRRLRPCRSGCSSPSHSDVWRPGASSSPRCCISARWRLEKRPARIHRRALPYHDPIRSDRAADLIPCRGPPCRSRGLIPLRDARCLSFFLSRKIDFNRALVSALTVGSNPGSP